jgi:hypothetical protein
VTVQAKDTAAGQKLADAMKTGLEVQFALKQAARTF